MCKRVMITNSVAILAAVFVLAAIVSVSAGAKEKPATKAELKSLIANAETKADHERVARYFDAEAMKYEAEAKEHGELAGAYKAAPPSQPTKFPGSQQTFNHCDSLSKSLNKAAEDARALATEHWQMAKEARK